MRIGYVVYLLILAVTFGLSVWCRKSEPALRYFPYLMGLTVLTEFSLAFTHYALQRSAPLSVYHIYQPLSYCLYALFFVEYARAKWIRYLIMSSIPFFILVSGMISWQVTGVDVFPGINYNIMGVLLIAWSVLTLFSLRVEINTPISRLPVFWICLALLVFHAGMFFYNFLFPNLLKHNSELAKHLQDIISQNLNYLLYVGFSVAFLCSNWIKTIRPSPQ